MEDLSSGNNPPTSTLPLVIPRSQHPISRQMIDGDALKVLYRLYRNGYLAYLVGGSVRDFLLGKTPKDFDVATNAHPHEIRALFRNSRTIGRRFRLVHVFFRGGKIIEVSTFRSRSEFEEDESDEESVGRRDSFGTPEEDALRRDITINGLFYNIADFSIIDYVGGIADLNRRLIRTIGDPDERFKQDPVRMIRVIRHAARTGFTIDRPTYHAILRNRDTIRTCSPARVRDEFFRELREGAAEVSLRLMLETDLLLSIFPDFERVFGDRNPFKARDRNEFLSLFHLVDEMNRNGKPLPEHLLLALFLIPFLRRISHDHPFLGEKEKYAYYVQTVHLAMNQAFLPFSIPKGIRETVFQVLVAQASLKRFVEQGMVPKKWRTKKHFLDAVILYGLLAQARGEGMPGTLRRLVPSDLLPWWPEVYEILPEDRPKRRQRFLRRKRRRGRRKMGPMAA